MKLIDANTGLMECKIAEHGTTQISKAEENTVVVLGNVPMVVAVMTLEIKSITWSMY